MSDKRTVNVSAEQIVQTATLVTGGKGASESSEDYSQRVISNVPVAFDLLTDTYAGPIKAAQSILNSKTFVATVDSVKFERPSTRVVVYLRTRPSDTYPDGIEPARTERTENDHNSAAWKLGERLKSLIGERVLVWIENQPMGNGTRNVRVIQHVKPIGPGSDHRED